MEGERYELTVPEGVSERLDRFVSERLELSRTRVQKLLAEGAITVDGRAAKKSEVVEPGSLVEVAVPEPDGTSIPTCSYNVLYRERDPRFMRRETV